MEGVTRGDLPPHAPIVMPLSKNAVTGLRNSERKIEVPELRSIEEKQKCRSESPVCFALLWPLYTTRDEELWFVWFVLLRIGRTRFTVETVLLIPCKLCTSARRRPFHRLVAGSAAGRSLRLLLSSALSREYSVNYFFEYLIIRLQPPPNLCSTRWNKCAVSKWNQRGKLASGNW